MEFRVGDGCNLPALGTGPLGCIITCNTLCRVPDPAKLLSQARDLLAPGGTLVLVESYTWTEETTPKVRTLGECNIVLASGGDTTGIACNVHIMHCLFSCFLSYKEPGTRP